MRFAETRGLPGLRETEQGAEVARQIGASPEDREDGMADAAFIPMLSKCSVCDARERLFRRALELLRARASLESSRRVHPSIQSHYIAILFGLRPRPSWPYGTWQRDSTAGKLVHSASEGRSAPSSESGFGSLRITALALACPDQWLCVASASS